MGADPEFAAQLPTAQARAPRQRIFVVLIQEPIGDQH